MNLDDAIVLETFPNRIAAELAAGLLESEGVEAMVAADDASGAFPRSSSSGECASWSTGRTRPAPGRFFRTWRPRPSRSRSRWKNVAAGFSLRLHLGRSCRGGPVCPP